MSYIDRHLMNGEHVIHREGLHWIIFAWPILLFLTAGAILTRGYSLAALAFASAGILMMMKPWMTYATTEFAVTDQRVVVKSGIVGVNLIEVLLIKVESVKVDQGITGNLFGYGSVTLTGSGGTHEPIKLVPNPMVFEKKIQEQILARGKSN